MPYALEEGDVMPNTMDIASFPTISTSHSNPNHHTKHDQHSLHDQRTRGTGEGEEEEGEKADYAMPSLATEPIRTTPSTIWTEKNRGVIGVNVGEITFVLLS